MLDNSVKVTGTLRGITGVPYNGGLVEVYLNSPMEHSSSLFGSVVARTFSDSHGKFSVTLVPSSFDLERENYYTFRIVKEMEWLYHKTISGAFPIVNFDELPDYIPNVRRFSFIGDVYEGITSNPTQGLTGMFTWQNSTADGSTSLFTAPGDIAFVALNGVVQSSPVDYIKRSSNVIEFQNTPVAGDLVALQYRI